MEWLWCEMWWGCLQVNLFFLFHHILCFAFIVCSLDSSSTLCTTNQRNVISNNSADDRVYIDNHDDEDELNTCQVLHLRLFSTPLESCVLHTSVISHPLQHPSTSSSHFLIVHDLLRRAASTWRRLSEAPWKHTRFAVYDACDVYLKLIILLIRFRDSLIT